MARYRELKGEGLSGLEASIQVRKESQERGQQHWHRLYERCWCGHLTVPSKYYEYKDGKQVSTQVQAEQAFLAAGGVDRDTEMLERYRTETPRTETLPENKRTGRPKKWASEAERLRAYRERSK